MRRVAVDYPYHCETGGPLGKIHWSGPYVRSPGQRDRCVPQLSFVYVCRGICDYSDERGRERRLGPGDMMVNLPGLGHSYQAPPGETWDEHYISCDGMVIDLWQREGLISAEDPFWRLLPVDYWVARMIDVVGDNPVPDADESLAQLGRLQVLLADMRMAQRSSAAYPEDRHWLAEAKKLLGVGQAGARPGLEAVADALGCDYHSFRRRFTRLSGVAPARYRMQAQIDLARSLMFRDKTLGNKELARLCGFCDEYHFSRQFKRLTGYTPSDYRRGRLASR